MKHPNHISRRAFLQTLTATVAAGYTERLLAQQAGVNPRNSILFYLGGGPQRWTFDLFLNPQNQMGFVKNGSVNTRFVASGGRYVNAEYATTLQKGIHCPWMWQFSIPTTTGSRPMSDLLDNMLVIQGLDSVVNDHAGAQAVMWQPLGSPQSISALAADVSNSSMRAISMATGSTMIFRSKSSVAPTRIDYVRLDSLLAAFEKRTGAGFGANMTALKSFLTAATDSMAAQAKSRHPALELSGSDMKAAREIMESGIATMTSSYDPLVTKYEDLIRRSVDMTTVFGGLNDLPIGDATPGARGNTYATQDNGVCRAADLRTEYVLQNGNSLARHMAMTEFIIANSLSQSITSKPDSLSFKNTVGSSVSYDEHSVGKMVALMSNTLNFRAHATCLNELITRLKAMNKFNDSVIGFTSEFGRTPHDSGEGTEHGSTASNFSFWSGAIPAPMILGKIRKAPEIVHYDHIGTFGEGDGSRQFGSYINTLATLLRVPVPVTASTSMVSEVNGVIQAVAEKTTLF